LVDNAVRFSPAGEGVEIDVSGDAMALRIAVRDHGPGISPKILPRIFDRFFTTDADRDGTGLGLSIVKAVVEAHGGAIEVACAEGTTFTVTLPLRR
ncbi:MAG: sensor histidine kinase, partial [Byssovorax sp.]